MENNHAMPATLRRRRRKKNATIKRQDADLEKEVDSYLNLGHEEPTTRKRQKKRAYGGGCSDASTEKATNIKAKGNSRAVPILLHLREIRGQSQQFLDKNGRSSWETLMLQQTGPTPSKEAGGDSSSSRGHHSTLGRLRVPVNPIAAATSSQWNAIQYSSPTYHVNTDENIKWHRNFWRPYTRQSIPFSKLKTPHSDAILAVDRWGGYLIGIGGGDVEDMGQSKRGMHPHLLIKFYGKNMPVGGIRCSAQNY